MKKKSKTIIIVNVFLILIVLGVIFFREINHYAGVHSVFPSMNNCFPDEDSLNNELLTGIQE